MAHTNYIKSNRKAGGSVSNEPVLAERGLGKQQKHTPYKDLQETRNCAKQWSPTHKKEHNILSIKCCWSGRLVSSLKIRTA